MQVSPSLAEFMARLNEGPAGAEDALAAIEKCAANSQTVLDLQQMHLTDEDLERIAPKFEALASHVTTLNLFMNECVFGLSSLTSRCLKSFYALKKLGTNIEFFAHTPPD